MNSMENGLQTLSLSRCLYPARLLSKQIVNITFPHFKSHPCDKFLIKSTPANTLQMKIESDNTCRSYISANTIYFYYKLSHMTQLIKVNTSEPNVRIETS